MNIFKQVGAVFCLAAAASAQTALTGAVSGVVADANGGRLASATVRLTQAGLGVDQTLSTDMEGRFRFVRVAPGGEYKVTIGARGFGEWQGSVAVLSGEDAVVSAVLALAGRQDNVVVADTAVSLTTTSPELSQTIDSKRLAEMPTNGRFLNRFALLNPHVRNTAGQGADASNLTRLSMNGAIFRETQYRLDGNTNYDTLFNNAPLQRLSISAVQEYRVLTNQFNAEHGSTSTGLIITTTKSGTEQYHGEALFFARPSGIQARQPLTSMRIPNQLLQGGASLGGPLVKGSTFFFVNYERLAQERGSAITSPAPTFFVGRYVDTLGLIKLDRRFNDNHWLTLRLNGSFDSNTNTNDRVGGLIQPSAGTRTATQALGSQLTDTAVFGRAVNELRAGYTNAVPSNTVPLTSQPVAIRPGYSTEGAASFTFVRTEVYQAADQFSYHTGSHTLKAGGDFIRRKVRDFSYDQFGSYTFAGGAPTPGDTPLQYTQRFGVSQLSYGQTQWAGFVQDTWRALPRVTLNLGLRYDYQSILDDYNNIGPRAGVAWDVFGNGGTVVRGGFGLFYDQPFFHGLTQRFLLNAVAAPFATYTLTPRDPGFPVFPASLSPDAPPANLSLAPRNVVIRGDKLLNPYTTQSTFGLQQAIGSDWVVSVNAIRSLTVKQFVHYDRNAPAPFVRSRAGERRTVAEADRTRPLYDPVAGVSMYQGVPIRQLRETVNGGSATYNALDASVVRRFSGRYQMEAHYVLSSALNNVTDDHLGANPNEWSNVGRGERGMSDYSQRHRFVAHGSVALPWRSQVSAIGTLASGLPVNALTGVDNNGDGTIVDRPATFGRNAFRGTSQRSLDASFQKVVQLSESVRIEFRADVFNVFNNSKYYVFNNVYGDEATPRTSFLRPVGGIANVDPGRQFTFGAKLAF